MGYLLKAIVGLGLFLGSIFAGLIGAFLFAVRGDPPWGEHRRTMRGVVGFPTAAWSLIQSLGEREKAKVLGESG